MEDTVVQENVVSEYIRIRDQRLALERKARELEAREGILKYAIERSHKLGSLEIPKNVSFELEYKSVPFIEDWDEFLTWVEETKNIEVFQKRITESVVKNMLLEGPIPGATTVDKPIIKASFKE